MTKMNKEQTSAEEKEILEDLENQQKEEVGDEHTEEQVEQKSTEASPEDEEVNTKYMRLMADFQNYKRRTEKEKSDIYAYANEKIVGELLDVIDNFERALLHGEGDEGFVQGMNSVFKILKGVLEKSGLEEIEALGMEFDPNFHNAVMTEDSTEYESNKVTQVLQRGYKFNGKTIRPSMVKVAN
jgi:molecular chaperone GrpE